MNKTHRKYSLKANKEDEPIKELMRSYKDAAIGLNPFPWNLEGNIASMPYRFRFELMILTLRSAKFIFYCFEKVFLTFLEGETIAEKIGMENFRLHQHNIEDMITATYFNGVALKDFFSFIDYDTMEQMVTNYNSIIKNVGKICKNKIIKNGCCMALTVVDRHIGDIAKNYLKLERLDGSELNVLGKILNSAIRHGVKPGTITDSQHILIASLLEIIGEDYVIEKFIIYNDSLFDEKGKFVRDENNKFVRNHHQMLMVIIRRIN